MPGQYEWNFIFLIYGDLRNLNEPDADINNYFDVLEIIQSLRAPNNCNIFLITNEIHLDNDREVTKDFFTLTEINNKNASKSLKIPANDISKKSDIIGEIFKKINLEKRSVKTALFTWDHGSVFGINRIINANASLFKNSTSGFSFERGFYINPFLGRKKKSKSTAFFNDVFQTIKPSNTWISNFLNLTSVGKKANIEYKIDMLSNEMLACAIIKGFGNKKIDVVCMMNCCMNNLFTQYALHNCVKYLIAPQTWIHVPGYDYKGIFEKIFRSPDISANVLAYFIIETYRQKALKCADDNKIHLEAIFATNLKKIKILQSLLKKLVCHEMKKINSDENYRQQIRGLFNRNYRDYSDLDRPNYSLVDLFQWYEKRINDPSPELPIWQKKIASVCFRLMQASIENKYIGKQIQFYLPIDLKFEPTGLALSLPNSVTYRDPDQFFIKLFFDEASPYRARLVKDLNLNGFLDRLYS